MLTKSKFVALLVVIAFAMLQLMQPFVHVHLDVQHPIQSTAFHIDSGHENSAYDAERAEPANSAQNTSVASSDNFSHASHTVTVVSVMAKPSGLNYNSILPIFVLLACVIALVMHPNIVLVLNYRPLPHKPLKRRLPATRAPPLV
jgi:hypothetical protein